MSFLPDNFSRSLTVVSCMRSELSLNNWSHGMGCIIDASCCAVPVESHGKPAISPAARPAPMPAMCSVLPPAARPAPSPVLYMAATVPRPTWDSISPHDLSSLYAFITVLLFTPSCSASFRSGGSLYPAGIFPEMIISLIPL